MFDGHEPKVNPEVCPFPDAIMYLYIERDYGYIREAWKLADHTIVDLPKLITKVMGCDSVELQKPAIGGENYAALITDGRAPNGGIVWESADFYPVFEQ